MYGHFITYVLFGCIIFLDNSTYFSFYFFFRVYWDKFIKRYDDVRDRLFSKTRGYFHLMSKPRHLLKNIIVEKLPVNVIRPAGFDYLQYCGLEKYERDEYRGKNFFSRTCIPNLRLFC